MIRNRLAAATRELARGRLALLALVVLVALVLSSLLVPVFFDVDQQDLAQRLLPPRWLDADGVGLLGTDQLGRDLLLRLLLGVRASFVISILAVALSFTIGTVVGMLASLRGGWAERVVVRFADIQLSFPALLIAMIFVASIGKGQGPLILILGFSYWMIFARMARQGTLSIRNAEYVEAAVTFGATDRYIVARHVLRGVLPTLVGVATVEFGRVALAEAGLSFLGFGLAPPDTSLGIILADGQQYLGQQWWVSTFAGLVLALLVLSMNVFGTWLQEQTDPVGIVRGNQ